ncbi:ABC transporter substrate-binding protein [candidate division WOR-3 bacterium]|nr:ABC transporter substrate-binding protein [candidate division WOR-3 bacterium]
MRTKTSLLVGALIAASIIGIVLMSGCIDEKTAETPKPEVTPVKEEAYKTVTDMRGKEVRIPKEPKRVVAISNGFIDTTMFGFGVKDSLVGIGGCPRSDSDREYKYITKTYTYSGNTYTGAILYPKIKELPNVGRPSTGINYEEVASLNPDIVIIRRWGISTTEEFDKIVDAIEKLNTSVVVLNDPNCYDRPEISTMYKEIEILGEVFDKQKEARALINYLDKEVQFIKERTKDVKEEEKPNTLFFGLSSKAREKGGVGNVAGVDSIESIFLEDIVNAKNAYRGVGRVVMSSEQVLALNPDVIILPTSYGYHTPSELYEDEAFKNIWELKAIKGRRVCSISHTSCRSVRLEFPIDLMLEAKCIYPEQFSDITLNEWVLEYYKGLYNVDDNKAEELKKAQLLMWLDEEGF